MSDPLPLSKLIEHVGDKHIVVQNILHSSPEITECKQDGRIAFYTAKDKAKDLIQQAACGKAGEWTALVVWIPTKKLP